MTDWQYWFPSRDGKGPYNVSAKTHEIHSTTRKRFSLSGEPNDIWKDHGSDEPDWLYGWKYRYRPRQSVVTDIPLPNPHYKALRAVLDAAYEQSAHGKGLERHGSGGKPWTEQPIFTIAGQVGDGFNAGQAIKKIQEAQQMAARGEHSKAMHEVLGAIVYAASLHVLWSKESNRDAK